MPIKYKIQNCTIYNIPTIYYTYNNIPNKCKLSILVCIYIPMHSKRMTTTVNVLAATVVVNNALYSIIS